MNNDTNASVFFDGHGGSFNSTGLTYRNVGINY